ncbi:MAG: glycoside hydrolase family 5 protein [Prevotella sp.]|nr:glycoside hydrolase family 5 protein [Prevotella sp.]
MKRINRGLKAIRLIIVMVFAMLTPIIAFADDEISAFESANDAVKHMKVGWNLGNTLDAHNGQRVTDPKVSEIMWGQPVTTPELMQMMKEVGFGAIRVPVTWYPHMDGNNKVDAAWMKRVHEIVDYVISTGMYCILNVHHDTGADSDNTKSWLKADETVYNQQKARYEYLWQQIAEEFKDYGERLLFESYNEMLDTYNSWCFASFAAPGQYNASVATSAYNAINSYAQSFVNTVRATGGNNAKRNLIVNTYGACNGAGTWNSHLQDPLKQMKLPTDITEGHIIFQVHAYPNVVDLSSAMKEVDQIFRDLNTYLVQKGAPVVIGEWGTSNGNDYIERRSNVLSFAKYFVEQAKAYNYAPFFWMGLSDGTARSFPAFNQADLVLTILQAYYGSNYNPRLLTEDDFEITSYLVNYNQQWSELNLSSNDISLSTYKAIRLELGETPNSGYYNIKVYGEKDGKEQSSSVSSQTTTLQFNRNTLGTKSRRITLQYMKTGNSTLNVKKAYLIKNDGTEIESRLSPFWGCTMEPQSSKKPSGIVTTTTNTKKDGAIYNLSGQRVTNPVRGIYIKDGKKYYVR